VGLLEELASLLEGEFPRLVPREPESEECLHSILHVFLSGKGYHVNYTAGRARPDLVVRRPKGRVEVPIEVKLTGTASNVDKGVEQLLGYMKGTDWKAGLLFIWDKSKKAAAYSRARELKKVEKRGRQVLVVAVRKE